MGYRDEVEALEAKLEEASADNARLRAENERLRQGLLPKVDERGPSRLLGAPTHLRLERTIEGELSPGAHRPLATLVRNRLGRRCSVISLGKTLVVRMHGQRDARTLQIRITTKDGKTHVVLDDDFRQVAAALFGGLGGGLGVGGMSGVVAATLALSSGPAVLVAAPLWLLGVLGAARWGFGRIVAAQRARDLDLIAEIAQAVRSSTAEATEQSAARMRVPSVAGEIAGADAEDEIEDGATTASERRSAVRT